MQSFSARLSDVRRQIAEAAAKAGRSTDEITLLAVSKTHPPEAVHEAIAAGQCLFGENRVQEARAKIPGCPANARWHLIGHLQKNKIRQALPLFELIHSVDSLELAQDIDRIAKEEGRQPRILLEVNVAGEESKFGFSPVQLQESMASLLSLEGLQIEGLMAIPPFADDPEASRPYFVALRKLREQLRKRFQVPLPELSMGMSHDFPVAIETGATIVRVGTALFGERVGKTWKPGNT